QHGAGEHGPRRGGCRVRQGEGDHGGQQPEAHDERDHGPPGALEARVVAPPERHKHPVDDPGSPAGGEGEDHRGRGGDQEPRTPALWLHPDATSTTCTTPAARPRAKERTTVAAAATRAAVRTTATSIPPVATGLSVRPTAASRPASIQSLDHPMDS